MHERITDWFGTPSAAAKTLIWLTWVLFLGSVMLGLLYLLVVGVLGAFI